MIENDGGWYDETTHASPFTFTGGHKPGTIPILKSLIAILRKQPVENEFQIYISGI